MSPLTAMITGYLQASWRGASGERMTFGTEAV
jgi:hypothetical protein